MAGNTQKLPKNINIRIIKNLYKMFIHETGRIKMYDKLFFIVWETHKEPFTKEFIDNYVNMDFINDQYIEKYALFGDKI